MNIRKLLLNFLLIRESETKLVSRLFVFEFFQGSAIALFFTAAISIFLQHRPTSDLPKVFVLSALLLWVAGYVYNELEHKLSTGKLITSVICFNASIILFFRLFMHQQTEQWFLYLFMAAFTVLYLLNNLEFWGLASQVFDVRQSKRLFGLISAGDIPAKMLGYLSAYIFVPIIGTENLLWLAVGLSLISIFLLKPLIKLAKIDNVHPPSGEHSPSNKHNIKAAITGNKLIRKIALVSFFSFASFLIVNFVFYGYVKSQFPNDNALAGFFAIFFAVIRAITLIIKIAGTNRMVDRIGLRTSLIISPFLLLIISGISINFSFELSSSKATFYLFGMMAVTIDVLRSAIQTPVLLATMQSLPVHQRLRGHTIIKGLLDPFSFFSIGVFLWIFTSSDHPNFQVLSIVLFTLICLWLLFAVSVDKNYKETLQTALRNRTLSDRDISITDKESLELLLRKVQSGSETEAISVLKLISIQEMDRREFFEKALSHSSLNVKLYALQTISSLRAVETLPILIPLLQNTDQIRLLPGLISTVSALDPAYDISSFLNYDDVETVRAATVASFLKDDKQKRLAEDNLNILFQSAEAEGRIKALKIVADLKITNFTLEVIESFNYIDDRVKKAAWFAAGSIAESGLMKKLMGQYITAPNDTEILAAIAIAGQHALPVIKEFLTSKRCEGSKSRKLIALLVKIGGNKAANILEECLESYPENDDVIIRSMVQMNIKNQSKEELYKKKIKEYLMAGSYILFKLQFAEKYNATVAKALESELESLRNKCLWLFCILYDAEIIKKAQAGFQANTKESVANALELVPLAVPKNFSNYFITLFEMASIQERCLQLQRIVTAPHLNESVFVKNILFDIDHPFNNWTKSCVLYSLRDKKGLVGKEFIEPFLHSNNEVLKDTAGFVLAKSESNENAFKI